MLKTKAKAKSETTKETLHVGGRDVTPDQRRKYFEALLANGGRQIAAAKAAGVCYTNVWEVRKNDPSFQADEKEAMDVAFQVAEDEARRRAIEGCPRTWFDKDGGVTRQEIEYSDTILLRLLERMETGSWRQRQQVELGGPGAFATKAQLDAAMQAREQQLAAARASMEAESALEAGAVLALTDGQKSP